MDDREDKRFPGGAGRKETADPAHDEEKLDRRAALKRIAKLSAVVGCSAFAAACSEDWGRALEGAAKDYKRRQQRYNSYHSLYYNSTYSQPSYSSTYRKPVCQGAKVIEK